MYNPPTLTALSLFSQEYEIDQCLTQKLLNFDGSDESAKPLNRLQPAKGKSHSEMCFKDIGVDCHTRMMECNLLTAVSTINCQPFITLAVQFRFNSFRALLQPHIWYLITGLLAKSEMLVT